MRSAVACSAFIAAACAAAPAASSRHLEYAFSSYSSAHVSDRASGALSGPGTGTLTIDLTDAPDGSTLVRAQEWWWHEPRPEQAVACTLHPSGDLTCNQYPLIDVVQYVLLPMLAPRYFSGSSRYAYTVVLPANYYSSAWTLDVVARTRSGRMLPIDVKGSSRIVGGPLEKEELSAYVLYDRVLSLPDEVHADLTATTLEAGIDEPESVDVKLAKDSAASASGSTPAPEPNCGRPSTSSAPPACSRRVAMDRGSYTYR
jgi:hypothetical protein